MSEPAALAAAIQKWKSTFAGATTNTEMIDLATAVHLAENKDFSSTVKVEKGLKYGSDPRQRLDVYYPISATPESNLPVAFYFHGGGMLYGDTEITPLFYANIGNYFASNSCITVVSTYRLLPTAHHPDGAEDATAALSWTLANASKYGGDPARIAAMGHSAGGSCIGTALWGGFLEKAGIQKKISSYIFLSAGLWYDVWGEPTRTNMTAYHSTTDIERVKREDPGSLFAQADKATMESWGKMVFFLGEFEFTEIVNGTMGCMEAWRKTTDRCLFYETIEAENHVSYIYSLGTKGSKIGPRLLEIVTK
ncbi:hypothetical protein BP5796_01196 [Coleophoma crateriformis]|uniref:BD-FAE-like domain-containing protein n=1 Tax=Coleophoma crateriformis TaxID=565419 RepID=A0A3D8SZR0_9HELO|nr:hypothetical protein BP5796_01196 [Coleophoma crateriformis]